MQPNLEVIGNGLTSVVMKKTVGGKTFALKTFKQNISDHSIKKEIKILQSLQHHNVIQLIEHDALERWLMTELLLQQDLFELLAKTKSAFKTSALKYITLQLAGAVQYIHMSQVAHRDIKLENILLDVELNLKLCDFGFAEFVDGNKTVPRTVGTPGYLAPELQYSGQISVFELQATDIFSLGVSIFLLRMAHPPFKRADRSCPFWRLINLGNWEKYWLHVDKTGVLEEDFKALIQGMLEPNPKKRMTISDVLKSPFLEGCSKAEYLEEVKWRLAG